METKNCITCDAYLKIGDFAYDQKICWDCFEKHILNILLKLSIDERTVIFWMLSVLAEQYKQKKSFASKTSPLIENKFLGGLL